MRTRGTGVDVSRHKGTVECLDGAQLRDWLCVPAGLPLPRWAEKRLARGVRAELEARKGTPLDDVVFGIVDLETTGLAARRDRILEIGLVVQLAEQLGVPQWGRHRALGDAEMTARLWHELLQRGRLRGVHTLEALRKIAEVGRSRPRGQRVRWSTSEA